ELLDGLGHRLHDARLVADVDLLGQHPPAELGQRFRRVRVGVGPTAPHDDVSARARNAPGEPETDARVPTGYEDDPPVEIEHAHRAAPSRDRVERRAEVNPARSVSSSAASAGGDTGAESRPTSPSNRSLTWTANGNTAPPFARARSRSAVACT